MAQLDRSILRETPFRFAGNGKALPSFRLNNSALAAELDIEQAWIEKRCGIESRCIAAHNETTVDLAVQAGRDALASSCRPGCLICSTFTPEYPLCPCAPMIAQQLGLAGIPAFDLNAACFGGVLGLLAAISFIASGFTESVLLIASDTISRHLARDDRQTRVLFGDGAAALVIERSAGGGTSLLSWDMGSDGTGAKFFYVPEGGSAQPWDGTSYRNGRTGTVCMEGQSLFRFAAEHGSGMVTRVCEQAGVGVSQVDWVLIHQANLRIIEALQRRTNIPPDRWIVNIRGIGNTGSSSVLLALTDLLNSGAVKQGDRMLVGAFGGGLTWAAALLQHCG